MNSLFQLLGSGIGVAIVSGVFMLIQSQMQRKLEEKATSKKLNDAKIDELLLALETMKQASLVNNRERIKYLCRIHISKGEVTYDERQDLIELYQHYHEGLGGNGNVEDLIKRFREVPVK